MTSSTQMQMTRATWTPDFTQARAVVVQGCVTGVENVSGAFGCLIAVNLLALVALKSLEKAYNQRGGTLLVFLMVVAAANTNCNPVNEAAKHGFAGGKEFARALISRAVQLQPAPVAAPAA